MPRVWDLQLRDLPVSALHGRVPRPIVSSRSPGRMGLSAFSPGLPRDGNDRDNGGRLHAEKSVDSNVVRIDEVEARDSREVPVGADKCLGFVDRSGCDQGIGGPGRMITADGRDEHVSCRVSRRSVVLTCGLHFEIGRIVGHGHGSKAENEAKRLTAFLSDLPNLPVNRVSNDRRNGDSSKASDRV